MLLNEKISRLKPSPINPRTITEKDLNELIDSIISFPQMLSLRPIVIKPTGQIIGGNMRFKALKEILKLSADGFARRFATLPNINEISDQQREYIFNYFINFFDKKEVPVINSKDLTPEQVEEFIIKDNTHFGRWDVDKLANEWNEDRLKDWGVKIDFGNIRVNDAIEAGAESPDFLKDKDKVSGDFPGLGDEASNDLTSVNNEGRAKSIILEYSPEDYEKVKRELDFRGGTAESVIFNLLGLK